MKSDFNFTRFCDDRYLLTNYAGRYAFLSDHDFKILCSGGIPANSASILKDNYFYSDLDDEEYLRNYAQAIRDYRDYLFMGTGLHIFVLTSSCNLKCVYCQASTCNEGKMMTKSIAEKSVDLALQSPSPCLSFEFQGGEPLLNFDVLKHIVLYTETHKGDKVVEYNLVSNLSLLTDEIIEFLIEHCVNVSTSLDGSRLIQNHNRPMPNADSYNIWKSQKTKYTERTGCRVGAIQTTTKYALPFYRELIDEYVENGFDRVFIRPLTPLGYASTRWDAIGYTTDEFLKFYKDAFEYILQKNREGIRLAEGHAVIFLDKIINHRAGNYTELRSPCGAGYGQLAYNHDGRIYTCDEGRMLAEMGDHSFQVGTVDSSYEELMNSPVCKTVATSSYLEGLPQCTDCVYAPYCGTCPVLTYYETKNVFLSRPNGYKCTIYKGMLELLFSKLMNENNADAKIIMSWVAEDISNENALR